MMTRKILTFAASALALGAFSFTPLAAQADAGGSQSIAVNASVNPDLTVSNDSNSLAFGPFDPITGVTQTYGFTVAFNNTGYNVEFQSQNTSGIDFRMKGETHTSVYIPYTITGVRAGDGGPYSSGAASATLTDLTPSFSFVVAGLGSETSAYPADTYSDALTLTVTPV